MAPTATVTLLFCDLVGSTAWQSALGDDAADQLRPAIFAELRAAVEDSGGREVKNLGDGLMAVFATSGAAALDAAAAMQRRFADEPDWPVLRVGVATGEATSEEDDWFGTPVITAARLCGTARPGEVLVAATTAGLVAGRRRYVLGAATPVA